MSHSILAVFVVGTLLLAGGRQTAAEPEPSLMAREGERIFRFYCQSCHGAGGAGDGPTAEVLTVKPADLTSLSRRNDGAFPLDRVSRSIDGRERNPAHGSEMPIWGLGFQDPGSDRNQENEVQTRIDQLIAYLQTIQE